MCHILLDDAVRNDVEYLYRRKLSTIFHFILNSLVCFKGICTLVKSSLFLLFHSWRRIIAGLELNIIIYFEFYTIIKYISNAEVAEVTFSTLFDMTCEHRNFYANRYLPMQYELTFTRNQISAFTISKLNTKEERKDRLHNFEW